MGIWCKDAVSIDFSEGENQNSFQWNHNISMLLQLYYEMPMFVYMKATHQIIQWFPPTLENYFQIEE